MPALSPRAGARRRRLRRVGAGLAIGAAAALLAVVARQTEPLAVAELRSYDLRTRVVAEPALASPDIVVVAIDDNSMERYRDVLGRWPWSRDVYEALLAYLHAAGARLAAFDVLFPDPDLANPWADTIFAEALAETGLGVLAFTLSAGSLEEALAWERGLEAAGVARADAALLERFRLPGEVAGEAGAVGSDLPYAEAPHPLFLSGARGLGSVVLNADPDGTVRRDRPVYLHRGGLYPSLAVAAARALEPGRFGGEVALEPGSLTLGRERVPLDGAGRMLLRYHGRFLEGGRATYPVYPVFRVLASFEQLARGLEPDLPLETFRDKVVVVGVTAVGTTEFEVRPTPLSAAEPGLMVHATALDNLLSGRYVRRAGAAADFALLAFAALGSGLLATAVASVTVAALGWALLLGLLVGGATWALSAGVWVELVAPALAGSLAFVGGLGVSYAGEGREKRRVREMFSRYVTPEYVSRLADNFETLQLGGERVPITILFSDIRGFTTMSERLPAHEVVEVLNDYLDRMTEVVFRHRGTLDKFIGDAVMAFWGAPVPVEDHARRAVEAALEMAAELEALNAAWEARGAPARLAIGIGVNTGEAIVGNIGSLRRKLDYTAVGDPVNLASRLESLNKDFGTTILVSEHTVAALGEGYLLRRVEAVTVKGKSRPVVVYELLGRAPALPPEGPSPGAARPGAPAAAARGVLGALLLVATMASGLGAQQGRARWTDWVYAPGAWVGGRLVPVATQNPETDSLALVARVEVFAEAPRWRAEIARVTDGQALAEPVVLVGERGAVVVITPVGATPLPEHAAAADPLVRRVAEGFGPDGRPLQPPPARTVARGAGGNVEAVTLRRPVARAEFDASLLTASSGGGLGRSLGRFGAQSLTGERSTGVTASAGARGVGPVRTLDGVIQVTPDADAVRRLEQVRVDILELERFLRELSAPAAAPAPPAPPPGAGAGEVRP